MATKTENRGGKRPGAGRKPLSELGGEKREEIIADVQAVAEKNGTSFGQELGKLMFGRNKDKRLMMSAMQLYARDILPRISEKEATAAEIKVPQIFIPEQFPDTDEAPDYIPEGAPDIPNKRNH